ncbi:MAG TPA: DUF4339 domain-containing protein [Methylomirabilota bacterium]|nr:DUF4339 domain-containing protein [Methylomirabilota bacterium]
MYKIIGADQKQYGPVSADELRQWIAEGRANAMTLIQAEGQMEWRPLSSFPEFATVPQPIPSGVPLSGGSGGAEAANLVSGPATGLLVVGILCALVSLWGVLSNLLGIGMGAAGAAPVGNMPPQFGQYMQMMSGGVGLVINFIALALAGLFIFASTKMRKLESYGLVMTATILSMLPCTSSCCCIGLPIGIWILIVLAKPEVKAGFH